MLGFWGLSCNPPEIPAEIGMKVKTKIESQFSPPGSAPPSRPSQIQRPSPAQTRSVIANHTTRVELPARPAEWIFKEFAKWEEIPPMDHNALRHPEINLIALAPEMGI
jgi:hypothetical protein